MDEQQVIEGPMRDVVGAVISLIEGREQDFKDAYNLSDHSPDDLLLAATAVLRALFEMRSVELGCEPSDLAREFAMTIVRNMGE